jgi:hypothetical protein
MIESISAAGTNAATQAGEQPTASRHVILEDSELLVAFDADSGALMRMVRKSSEWMIERRPELGASFRLLVPLPKQRANFVIGQKQHAVKVEKVSESKIEILWKDPLSEHGGVIPLDFSVVVSLENGTLSFNCALDNRSDLPVETIEYPYFGDLNPPTRDANIMARHLSGGGLGADPIYPHFANDAGYWGVFFPQKKVSSNQSQICLIQTPEQGIYVGMHDLEIRYFLQFIFELHPGYIYDGLASREDEISGIPVHIEFRVCHFVFVSPHSNVTLAPVVMRAYAGDWQAGIDIYKAWRATWFKAPSSPPWTKDVHSWLELQMDTPVEDASVTYRKLEEYAKECEQNGITAIQLVGWNKGGHDRGGPSQDTEPLLGTWSELHDAIARMQARNLKIILFAQLYWADWTTDWYKNELHKYEVTDPYGNAYPHSPEGFLTPSQLTGGEGMDRRRCSIMDVVCPAYREIAVGEFEKILALGAAGWFHGSVANHSALYSFDQDHGYTAPGYLYSGDLPLSRSLRAASQKNGSEFLFAGDTPQDWLTQYYSVSHISVNPDEAPVSRYLDPHAPLLVSVTGLDARETLNLILLYQCVISYKPSNFAGHLDEFPLTLTYGKKIDALRRRYKQYLWDAEYQGNVGARVGADGACRYAVYRTPAGKRGVVVINLEQRKAITATIKVPGAGEVTFASPEDTIARPASPTLRIPARSAIVVMEQ